MSKFLLPAVRGSGQTIGLTVAVIATLPLALARGYYLKGSFVGTTTFAGNLSASGGQCFIGAVHNALGSGTIGVSTPSPAFAVGPGMAGITVVLSIDAIANVARLIATGVAGQTIDWMGLIEAVEFEP